MAPGGTPPVGSPMLNITDIRITKVEHDEKLRAFVSMVLDGCFLVGDMRVLEGDEGFFVAMPSKRKRDGSYKDIAYPINQETREILERQILLAYEAATGQRALSRIETGDESIIRPDLLNVEEFGFTPKGS